MDSYSYDSILCNGREIMLDDILDNKVTPGSSFEASTFSFIRQWSQDVETFIQNTSGSTGTPKPITIRRDQMLASARLTQQFLGLIRGDTALICLDPEYIAGKMMLVRSFVTDMKIVAAEPSSNPFRRIPTSLSIDFTALVPLQLYEIIASAQAYRLNSIRNILIGGAALNPETQTQLTPFNGHVFATYGMTETVSHVALQAINGPNASEYFAVLPGIKIETDKRGCLVIDAPYLTEKISTNDLVEMQGESHFRWLGRNDNIINSGGIKVMPEKIEAQVSTIFIQHGIENKFLIAGVPDATLGYKIILLVEGDISDASMEIIMRSLKEILPPYEAPKEIYDNVKFILTKNGKINRLETVRHLGN